MAQQPSCFLVKLLCGKFPVESVKTMAQIAKTIESEIDYWKELSNTSNESLVGKRSNMIIGHTLCEVAMQSNADAIFSLSSGGHTPVAISSFKPKCPIYAITPNLATARQMNASWGITPILVSESENPIDMINEAIKIAKENNYIFEGQTIVIGESDTYTKSSKLDVSISKNIGGIYVV